MSPNAPPVNATPPPSRESSAPGNGTPAAGGRDETIVGGGPESAAQPESSRGPLARLEEAMKKPSVGATVSGAVVLGAAAFFGVLETAIAAGAAYAAYRLLRKKRTAPPPARPRS
jgi:hypothetical protein